jgi:SmpA / OmlA family
MYSIRMILPICLSAAFIVSGQTPGDPVSEIALLKRTVADQNRRIAGLEKTVRSLQTTVLAATRPATAISWRIPKAWAAIRIGMSRAQVEEILGEPKSADSVMDRQKLYYKDGPYPVGTVVITDDRVSEVACPRFQIYVPGNN